MTTTGSAPQPDEGCLIASVFRAVDEFGTNVSTALVVVGDHLGYYRSMADCEPVTAEDLAARTRTGKQYAREWLNAQTAAGYVWYDPGTRRYALRPAQPGRSCLRDEPLLPARLFQIVDETPFSRAPEVGR